MANYDVDIKIALKGSQKLKQLTDQLKATNKEVGKLNAATIKAAKSQDESFSIKKIQNINNYSKAVAKAERTLRRAAAGTEQEQLAVKALVAARKQHNQQLERQNKLLKEEELLQGVGRRPKVKGSNRISASSGLSSPLMGARDIKGSPMARAFGYKPGAGGRGRGSGFGGLQSAALGVGFPLLFGGGAGSIAGGLLGSLGGFGGQILGSAIGAQLDAFASSAAKLGQALDPVNGSLEDLVVASGNTGTAFGSLLVRMEEVLGKERAIEAATAQLATVIGTKGVTALRDFGRDTADLGNEFAKAVTQVTAAMAELINKTGFLKSLIEVLAKDNYVRAGMANDTDPELQRLKQQRKQIAVDVVRDNPYQSSEALEKALSAQDDLIAKRARELEIAKQIELTNQANADILNEKSALHNVNTNLLTAQLELEASGLDLTTDAGLALAEKVEARRTDVKLQEAINAGLSVELVLLEGAVNLARLKRRAEAARDAANKRGVGGGVNKEEAVQKGLATERVKQFDLDLRLASIGKDRLAVIQDQLAAIDTQTALREQQILINTEDERLQQAKLVTLSLQRDIQREQLKLEEQKIIKQRQLQDLQQGREQQRSLREISTDITRRIADAGRLTTGNPFEDAQLELRVSQVRREEDAITQLTDALEKQRDIRKTLTADQTQEIKVTDQEIINLTERIELTKQLLPQLDAAEQAQLRFNQALEAVQPITDTVVSGLFTAISAVVEGTKTAEEAFADFLKNIGDMLIQTAAQMIAQYIAIGIAKAFAFGGSGGFASNPTGTSTNFIGSGLSGFRAIGLAEGGYVTGPTRAVVGEGGEPEYIIPQSKMRESMDRYSRGARGSSVIPAVGGGGASSEGGGVAVAAPIDVRYTVERINDVDYVTAEQFQQGIQQAAQRGAAEGERRTMRSLQNSTAVRRSLAF